ncbi:unnamed protein product [Paramecium primaurelia]|uniref:Protein kinase domain-containing protein n=1 Tax=Paramecium primaurelia TaxID=5886 RepID=A0A8S1KMU2_PARPR|nr:unnamed protein product [Paramecium primaurelia]
MNRQEIMNMKPEKKISNYGFSLKAILGKGSYGTVYFGREMNTQLPVALKVIDHSKTQNYTQLYQSLHKEIEIMKKLKHSNIVELYEVYSTPNNTYLVQEYCNGPDLKQYLSEKKILEEDQAIKMIKQIANGLKEIVSNNFIHRDLKPANILMHDGQCKIGDFGFSRPLPSECVMESLVGTPLYMAPQILTKQQYTSKCDVWSLGLIFYEMLFGTLPWMATNYMELIYRINNCKLTFPKNNKISKESLSFIQGCLHKDEVQRFSWNEVFLHPLIKPQMKIPIDPGFNEIFSPKFSTHRQNQSNDKSALPTLRERSCSGKNPQNKLIEYKSEIKIEQKQEPPPASSSQQSTEGEENTKVGKYYLPKQQDKLRRTRSQFENIKPNQTEINPKRQIQQPLPSNGNLIKQAFPSKKRNLFDLFKKNNFCKLKSNSEVIIQLLDLIASLEKEVKNQDMDLETFLNKERTAITNGHQNQAIRIKIAQQYLNKLEGRKKRKLETFITLLQKDLENEESPFNQPIQNNVAQPIQFQS